jgi:hypothetical protein
MTPPDHWSLRRLTLPQRLAAGCGCVTILACLAAAGLYAWFELQISGRMARELADAPAGWADSVRAVGRSPDLSGLALARTDTGDGAAAAHDGAWAWPRPGVDHAYRVLITPGTAATPEDSATWRSVAADTALDRFVAAARRHDWRATDRVLAGDSLAHRNYMTIRVPDYRGVRTAGRGLVIRALMRLRRGDRDGARADLGAVVGLGEQMFRHEPSLAGTLVGRSLIASGVHGWAHYAQSVRDSALAERAALVGAWASVRPPLLGQWLVGAPDTALAIAADTSLALGLRGDAMADVLLAFLLRPRGFVFGVPGRYERALRAVAAAGGDAGSLAAIAAVTAQRANLLHMSELMREVGTRH